MNAPYFGSPYLLLHIEIIHRSRTAHGSKKIKKKKVNTNTHTKLIAQKGRKEKKI
jgi:hypothetical protein